MLKKLTVWAALFIIPGVTLAANNPRTLSGTVVGISGSQVIFKTPSAAKYAAEVGSANLVRKYGTVMKLQEILAGDRVEVTGNVWADNSISATYLRNMSLYGHNSTFMGKILSLDAPSSSFVLQSKANGEQTVNTSYLTTFTKNGSASSFDQLELGMDAKVKSVWERVASTVFASQVIGTVRLVNIDISGTLMGINGNAITVVADNVVYGVDGSGAKIENKSAKISSLSSYAIGDKVKVEGKHISGSVSLKASLIKDLSVTK